MGENREDQGKNTEDRVGEPGFGGAGETASEAGSGAAAEAAASEPSAGEGTSGEPGGTGASSAESTSDSSTAAAASDASAGTGSDSAEPGPYVRLQDFEADGPVELDLGVTIGRVEVVLGRESGVTVRLQHDAGEQPSWVNGVSSLLSWVGEKFGDQFGGMPEFSVADAVRQARIEKTGNRVVVRAAKAWQLRNVPVAVTVHAPAGSHLEVRAGSADVTVTGTAGRADILTGSGEVTLERADGAATIRTGTGAVKLGPTLAGLQLRSGSGSVEAASISGPATLGTGTGNVWLGAVEGDVMARTGSGDLSVADAASGSLELITGSGEVRVGIRSGVRAEVELASAAGRVSSELDVSDTPPEGAVALKVRARTGTGNAVVTRAAG
ncbi:putative adhesin [Amycolatopsis echigonensis]|uniref:Adhesin n=1 Tax=Amycolatopsis echigonensis TaxID=2576905 RepID=A0A2N3WVJ6_9PSEU|nr:putative adhesin [Amycolatopsis niigatensis]